MPNSVGEQVQKDERSSSDLNTALICGAALMLDPRGGRKRLSSFRALLIRFSESQDLERVLPVLDLLIELKGRDRLALLKHAARWHKSAAPHEREAFEALAGGLLNMATENVLVTGTLGNGDAELLRELEKITGCSHLSE